MNYFVTYRMEYLCEIFSIIFISCQFDCISWLPCTLSGMPCSAVSVVLEIRKMYQILHILTFILSIYKSRPGTDWLNTCH